LCPIGKTAPSSNDSPDTLGGLRRYKHCDINSPERYENSVMAKFAECPFHAVE
jgi:hypothetical protein